MNSSEIEKPIETELYADSVIKDHPENFTSVEVKGVREGKGGAIDVDEENPQFFTAYVRHVDGRAFAIADSANAQEVIDYGRDLVAGYADAYGWTFID